MTVTSIGGMGGGGGAGSSVLGRAQGGNGGAGGAGGAAHLTIRNGTFSGPPSNADSTVLNVLSRGGSGGIGGTARGGNSGGADAGNGGHGGAGGPAELVVRQATVTGGNIAGLASAVSSGGNGGFAGVAETSEFDTRNGGDGGSGGAAMDARLSFESGVAEFSQGGGIALLSQSNGGEGRAGGSGAVINGAGAAGGSGGSGGVAGQASLSIGQVRVNGGRSDVPAPIVVARSLGGAGGAGGAASALTGYARGGQGGHGASAGGAELTLTQSTIYGSRTTQGLGAVAALSLSEGGAGGAGGRGNTTGTSGTLGGVGGVGGTGGSGGPATLEATDVSLTTAGMAVALGARSLGGQGGDGGQGDFGVGQALGAAGGAGGDGGAATLSVDGGTIVRNGLNGRAALQSWSSGGDGGRGGNANSTLDAGVSRAGSGGLGGNSGDARVEALGVTVTADAAMGIEALSSAGTGGRGGDARASAIGDAAAGAGGQGGSAGQASIEFTGELHTTGGFSYGLVARSLGGAGGAGGNANAVIGAGTGGAGAGSGPGGGASVEASGTIVTGGPDSTAILAQSIGGFSGSAGGATGIATYGAGSQSAGDGGKVNVIVAAGENQIETTGLASYGINAQSIGGGGGTASSASGIGALGGNGSAGGDGGQVTVSAWDGLIRTSGDMAQGVSAQSIGGGGGSGGAASGIVALGATGGSGGSGGQVSVISAIDIETGGRLAVGLNAQSIGGGGGSAQLSAGVGVTIGGNGAAGGNGGAVDVTNQHNVTTRGADASAILVQSIGGGGGNGAQATTGGTLFGLAQGGQGSAGGHGGAVSYAEGEAAPTITTAGARASGIDVSSVGGGGGRGGAAVAVTAVDLVNVSVGIGGNGAAGGDGGTAAVTTAAQVSTSGESAVGVSAVSVGGGGGNAGLTVNAATEALVNVGVAVGGAGGGGGAGGAVSLMATGAVSTIGDHSDGVVASSVGGGGGSGGVVVNANAASGVEVGVSIGGSGGAGGHGAPVDATVGGLVTTLGDHAGAVRAASIGGGGGDGGVTVQAGAFDMGSVDVTVGGNGGASGHGAAVSLSTGGTISTAGENADAVTARSISSGGGSGGATLSGTALTGADVRIGVGGNGGAGGAAGAVSAQTAGVISTEGENSTAITVESIGGGGGDSGLTATGDAITLGSISVTVGGSGGKGGTAGDVTLENTAAVTTLEHNAGAILARSVGGSGGTAQVTGAAEAITIAAVPITVGGTGGSGGTGGDVSVKTGGAISTMGVHSPGLHALSQGGSGGTGGTVFQGSITIGIPDVPVSGSIAVNVGGAGGEGATAGAVEVSSLAGGTITTNDVGSRGIFAQSIGGNGGAGGAVYAGELNFSPEASAEIGVAVGGAGGSGAIAGPVTVSNAGSIGTNSAQSDGILAQSIGGNGGVGGSVFTLRGGLQAGSSLDAQVDIGGQGGTGGHADAVTVSNSGDLVARGNDSHGIDAQSIGGGGGSGGNAFNVTFNLADILKYGKKKDGGSDEGGGSGEEESTEVSFSASVNVGGAGGAGGDGDAVQIDNTGTVITHGANGFALTAQSVGGGGGRAGGAGATTFAFPSPCKLAGVITGIGSSLACDIQSTKEIVSGTYEFEIEYDVTVNVGGAGGAAGNGASVRIGNAGTIHTTGSQGVGIHATSIGGGGGHGGSGEYEPELFEGQDIFSDVGKILQDGYAITAIAEGIDVDVDVPFAELPSLAHELEIGVGGVAGAAGDGGPVTVTNDGTIVTSGDQAHAIYTQSIGGGGGTGGQGVNAAVGLINVGGQGSGGGHGGAIDISSAGTIVTTGLGSAGILAQSVGGGGGTAGDVGNVWGFAYEDHDTIHRTDLLFGDYLPGAGGDGGDITIDVSGGISTTGNLAHGIIAQSIGGSGGLASDDDDADDEKEVDVERHVQFASSRGDVGSSGDVIISSVGGTITTTGDRSHGIVAQSQMGSEGENGDVTITAGTITTTGERSRAILALAYSKHDIDDDLVEETDEGAGEEDDEGDRPDDLGTVAIEVDEEAVIATLGSEETIMIMGGGGQKGNEPNTIVNHGIVSNLLPSGEGYAIRTDGEAGLRVTNTGLMQGRISQESGARESIEFINTGTLVAGDLLALGAEGHLVNHGVVEMGERGSLDRIRITGDVTQTADARLIIDASLGAGEADIIEIDGVTKLGGVLQMRPVGLIPLQGEEQSVQIILGAEQNIDPVDTAAVDYTTVYQPVAGPDDLIRLDYQVDYLPVDRELQGDELRFSRYLIELIEERRTSLAAGGDDLAFIDGLAFDVLEAPTEAALAERYREMLPGNPFAGVAATDIAAFRFSDSLMSCPDLQAGTPSAQSDLSCRWLRLSGQTGRQEGSGTLWGYDAQSWGLSGGLEMDMAAGWTLAAAAAGELTSTDGAGFSSEGVRFSGGVAAAREFDTTALSFSLSGGFETAELSRRAAIPGGHTGVSAETDRQWLAGHMRAGTRFDITPGAWVTPTFDIGIQHLSQSGYTEEGAGDYGFDVGGVSSTTLQINPFIKGGFHVALGETQGEVTLRAGALAVFGDEAMTAEVRYAGQNGTGPSFTLTDDMTRVFADVGVSVDLELNERTTLGLAVDAFANDDYQDVSASALVSIRF
ncbi:hypothetical protein ACXN5S_10530 [Pseudoroseicyclus sp. H15]